MKQFKFSLPSHHSPEDVWEALNTPLPQDLNHAINSRKVLLHYEGLGETGRIQQGTRLVYTPNLKALGLIPQRYIDAAPAKGTAIVGSHSSDKTRVNIIEPGQIARGNMQYKVEESEDGTGLLVVEGELAIEGLEKLWPSALLGDINDWSTYYGIQRPAERLLKHVPDVLAATNF